MNEHLKKKMFYFFETLQYDRYYNKLTLIDKWKNSIPFNKVLQTSFKYFWYFLYIIYTEYKEISPNFLNVINVSVSNEFLYIQPYIIEKTIQMIHNVYIR